MGRKESNQTNNQIRKYHNHKLQTNPPYREEELQNIYSNKTSNRHNSKSTSSFFLVKMIAKKKNRKDIKKCIPKQRPTQNPHRQCELHKTMTTEPPHLNGQQPKPLGGGLNAFYQHQLFAQDSDVVNKQSLISSHEGFLTSAMHHHRETI